MANRCLFCTHEIPAGDTLRIVTRYSCQNCWGQDIDAILAMTSKLVVAAIQVAEQARAYHADMAKEHREHRAALADALEEWDRLSKEAQEPSYGERVMQSEASRGAGAKEGE